MVKGFDTRPPSTIHQCAKNQGGLWYGSSQHYGTIWMRTGTIPCTDLSPSAGGGHLLALRGGDPFPGSHSQYCRDHPAVISLYGYLLLYFYFLVFFTRKNPLTL